MKKLLFAFLLCLIVQRTFAQDGVIVANGFTVSGTNQSKSAILSGTHNGDGTYSLNVNSSGGGGGGGGNVVVTGSTSLVLTSGTFTTSGTIAAGSRYSIITSDPTFTGSVKGLPLAGGQPLNLFPMPSYVYPAIPYVVTSGTLYILSGADQSLTLHLSKPKTK